VGQGLFFFDCHRASIKLTSQSHFTTSLTESQYGNIATWQNTSQATFFSWSIQEEIVAAQFSGLPTASTDATNAEITVGGPGVTAYKFQVGAQAVSTEYPISQKISLKSLNPGNQTISVWGKNASGKWQKKESPTTFAWSIGGLPFSFSSYRGVSSLKPGALRMPRGLCCDSAGNYSVADGENHRVQNFLKALTLSHS
jgi:hypothetical protein